MDSVGPLNNVKIKVFDCSKQRLLRDSQRAAEFDQSQFFRKVYDQEYATFGGEPFGCLLFDYLIDQHPNDLELVERLFGAHIDGIGCILFIVIKIMLSRSIEQSAMGIDPTLIWITDNFIEISAFIIR